MAKKKEQIEEVSESADNRVKLKEGCRVRSFYLNGQIFINDGGFVSIEDAGMLAFFKKNMAQYIEER